MKKKGATGGTEKITKNLERIVRKEKLRKGEALFQERAKQSE